MHQTKKGNQHYFVAKAHIGVDDESGLVPSVVVTATNVADITEVDKLLHGAENVVCADAGYTGVEKREEHAGRHVIWQIASRRSINKKHGTRSALYKARYPGNDLSSPHKIFLELSLNGGVMASLDWLRV